MLTYNMPDVTGYSVSWMYRIMHIHAHTPGEDLAFYTEAYDKAAWVDYEEIWIYFPLAKGETISEVWKVQEPRRASDLIVSLLTLVSDFRQELD